MTLPMVKQMVPIICEFCSKMHKLLVKNNENGGVQIIRQSLPEVTCINVPGKLCQCGSDYVRCRRNEQIFSCCFF